jgi:GDP-L-fucose synthase
MEFEVLTPRHTDLDLNDEVGVYRYLERNRVDYVVHCAVKPGHRNAPDTSQLLLNNLRMYFSLERNQELYSRLVVVGSGAIYDNRRYGPKRTEESYGESLPYDEHGFAKYVIEKSIEHSRNAFDLRVFGIYGRYEDYQIRFISNMICKALAGLPLTIKQDRRFDYLWVEDLAPIVVQTLLAPPKWKSINVTPDQSASLLDIARLVLEVVGRPELPLVVAQPGIGLEYSGDNSRLRLWMPDLKLTPLRNGIEKLTEWYRGNWTSIDKSKLTVDP